MTATNGSIWTTSVETLMPTSCSAVAIESAMPNSSEPIEDPDRAAAAEHGDDDGDEPEAAGHERHEDAGRDDGHVAAAEAGQGAGRQHGDGADLSTSTPAASSATGFQPAARMLSPRLRLVEHPADHEDQREADVDDQRLAEDAGSDARGCR